MDCGWIGWCALDQSSQAAWAQAVFSVVGIGVAILVPYLQHRNAAKVRARDAQALAASKAGALFKHVKIYAQRVDRTKDAFDGRSAHEDAWRLGWPAPPAELSAAAAALHDLGQPGTELVKAIHRGLEMRDILDDNYYVYESSKAEYERHLNAVYANVHAALLGMRALLES